MVRTSTNSEDFSSEKFCLNMTAGFTNDHPDIRHGNKLTSEEITQKFIQRKGPAFSALRHEGFRYRIYLNGGGIEVSRIRDG